MLARAFTVMTAAAVDRQPALQLHDQRQRAAPVRALRGVIEDPALLGALLALIYTIASFAQIVVGRLIDRMPFKPLQLWMSVLRRCRC